MSDLEGAFVVKVKDIKRAMNKAHKLHVEEGDYSELEYLEKEIDEVFLK